LADFVHRPDQQVLDYRKQQRIRNAPFVGMAATAMTGVFSGYLASSLGVHWAIGPYAANFFPGVIAKPFLGLPVYSPLALGKAWWQFRQYPMMQSAAEFALAGTLIPTLAMGVWQFIRIGKLQNQAFETDLHGSAHWATKKEIQQMALLPASGATPSKRTCYVGGIPDKDGRTLYLQHAGAEHIICFAPTRSGKGVGLVLPTLLGGWQESVVVHDIKGENYLLTAGWRQSIGQTILKFNPGYGMPGNNEDQGSKNQCCHFNPLEEVRVGTPFEVKDVQNIATMIVDPDGKGLNDHWQKTGFALLTSVILHVLYAEKDKTLRGVAAFLNDPELTNVDEAFTKMIKTEHNQDGIFDVAWKQQYNVTSKVHPVIAQSAKEMLNKAPNEKSGVISTMMSFLSLYRDPIVAEWTEYSDFRITDLQDADNPVSLYLVTSPEDKNRLKPLIRLVLNLIASKFTSEDRLTQKDGRMVCTGKHPLLLLLDEFPSLGKMDIFQDAIAFFAGYNVKLFLITQSKSQLEDEAHGYGKAGGSVIIENCHVRIFYAPNDITTAEWLSKTLGKKTVPMENTTQSLEGSLLPSVKGQSRSISWQARDLLTPDEVLRLRGPIKQGSNIVQAGDMIVMVAGFAPVYGRQILYFKDATFLRRAQVPPPDAFEPLREPKSYKFLGEKGGVLAAKREDTPPLDDADFVGPGEPAAPPTVAEQPAMPQAEEQQASSTMTSAPENPLDRIEAELAAASAESRASDTTDVLADKLEIQNAQTMLAGARSLWPQDPKRVDRIADMKSLGGLLGKKDQA